MAGTGPTIPTDPLELLSPDPTRLEPWVNPYWGGALTSSVLWAGLLFTNYALKKPVFSSLHFHGLVLGGGWFIGQYYDNMRKAYFAERDAIFRHYIQLHPEDFPVAERRKYSELLLPWHPVR